MRSLPKHSGSSDALPNNAKAEQLRAGARFVSENRSTRVRVEWVGDRTHRTQLSMSRIELPVSPPESFFRIKQILAVLPERDRILRKRVLIVSRRNIMTEDDRRISYPYFFGSEYGRFSPVITFDSTILGREHRARAYIKSWFPPFAQ